MGTLQSMCCKTVCLTERAGLPAPNLQFVWAPLPGAGTARYAVQRWPSRDMPAPGQPGYLDSLLHLQAELDPVDGTYSAAAGAASADGRPFFRVLALDSGGGAMAATRPARAVVTKGERLRSGRFGSALGLVYGVARSDGLRCACRRHW